MTKWKCNECTPSCTLASDNTEPSACPYQYEDFRWGKVSVSARKSAKKPKRTPAKKVEHPVKKYLF